MGTFGLELDNYTLDVLYKECKVNFILREIELFGDKYYLCDFCKYISDNGCCISKKYKYFI